MKSDGARKERFKKQVELLCLFFITLSCFSPFPLEGLVPGVVLQFVLYFSPVVVATPPDASL